MDDMDGYGQYGHKHPVAMTPERVSRPAPQAEVRRSRRIWSYV